LAACNDHAAVRAAEFEAGDLRAIRERLVAEDHLSRDGVNRQVYAIRRAFRWAREESLVPASVPVDLEAVRGVPRNEGRSTPDPETADAEVAQRIIQYLAASPDRAAAGRVVAFLRWTGARPSEANRATIGMLSADRSRLVIPARLAKTSRDRVVPLNAAARTVVNEAITAGGSIDPASPIFKSNRGQPFTSSGILQAMRKAAVALCLPRTTPYSLRRLAATEVLIATGSEAAAAAVLGHSTRSKVIERYTRNRADLAVSGAESIGRSSRAG
jgi:integrase